MLIGVINQISNVGNLPQVNTFADLPAANSVPSGTEYVVLTATGVWLVNRKSAGIYNSDGSTWSYIGAAPIDAGVPAGGTAGQALTKIDGTDYNTQWSTVSGGGSVTPNFWELTHSPTGANSFRENGNGGSPSNNGTYTSADANLLATFGNHIQAATPATANNNAGIRHAARIFLANTSFYNTTGKFVSYFGTPATIGSGATGGRMAVGLLTSNSLDDMLVDNILQYGGLAFTYSTSLSQTVWHYQDKGANTPTPIATSLTYAASKLMRVQITLTASPTVHIMRLDNLTDNTTTGDISVTRTITGASAGLYGHCGIRTLSNTARTMYLCDQKMSSLGVRNA